MTLTAETTIQDDTVRPVARCVWRPAETEQVPSAPSASLRQRDVAVLGGAPGEAEQVVAALRAAGARPHLLTPQLEVAAFRAATPSLDAIVDLNLPGPFALHADPGWQEPLSRSIALLQSCYPQWTRETDANRLGYLAVTRMGGRMGADPVAQPLGGLWAGLAKGLPREIPACNVRVLDVAEGEPLADLVVRELYRWGLFEVGHRDGRRWTLVPHPEPSPAPRLRLGAGDVVVLSGGGRGIGFALARGLAAEFGCRVLVSGRAPLPDPAGQPAVAWPAERFRRYRDDTLVAAAAERLLPQARAELARLERDRDLWANLAGARAEGLDIAYHRCDITDPGQVDALLDAAGPGLAGIVHNAGLDEPVRLPGKRPASVASVVGVKVDGFVNLARAAARRTGIGFLCNAGSLTGRLGGMVGQLDYGAANEALARLGAWARDAGGLPPVTTVCWPTWERLGMIANYEATLRYMSALDVGEGVRLWRDELLGGAGGEVSFLGEIGPALLPSVLRGYRPDGGGPDFARLERSRWFLGEPVTVDPGRSIASALRIDLDAAPCCDDARLDGRPALPVSLLLAHLLAAGEWTLPERPNALLDVRVTLAALAGPQLRLVKTADGADVRVLRDGVEMARAGLGLREAGPVPVDHGPADDTGTAAGRLSWGGHAFRIAAMRRHRGTGRWCGEAGPDRMSALLLDGPPGAGLPLNAIESVLRAAQPGPADGLAIDSLVVLGDPGPVALRLLGSADGRDWTGVDAAGHPRLAIAGLRFITHREGTA